MDLVYKNNTYMTISIYIYQLVEEYLLNLAITILKRLSKPIEDICW